MASPLTAGAYLLDASAFLVYIGDEPGSEVIQELLEAARRGNCRLLIPPIALMEACAEVWLEEGEEGVRLLYGRLAELPIQQVEMDEEMVWLAGQLKATRPLSMAEAWLLAAAKRHQATIVHKDPVLGSLKEIVPFLSLG